MNSLVCCCMPEQQQIMSDDSCGDHSSFAVACVLTADKMFYFFRSNNINFTF